MKGDNIESVPQWVYRRDASWTVSDPLTVVGESWFWTCGDCGKEMPRADIPGHRSRHAIDDGDHPEAVVVWVAAATVAWLLLILIVVAAWRR